MDDCYFYYFATCTKGQLCAFRHEPSARSNPVTCTFWIAGKCRNNRCSYRHMDLSKVKNVSPVVITNESKKEKCYWETQPGGCKKPNCPFLHSGLPVITPSVSPPSSRILVNKDKCQQMGGLILPTEDGNSRIEVSVDHKGEASTKIVASAKSRLGIQRRVIQSKSIKDRLGFKERTTLRDDDDEHISGDDESEDSETESLRKSAIRSLDLRNRLNKSSHNRVVESRIVVVSQNHESDKEDDDESSSAQQIVDTLVKKVKKDKKKKKKKDKKNKKSKKHKKLSEDEEDSLDSNEENGDSVTEDDKFSTAAPKAPSNSLGIAAKTLRELKNHKSKLIRQIAEESDNEKQPSLAAKIAAEREDREPGTSIRTRKRLSSSSVSRDKETEAAIESSASTGKRRKMDSSSFSLEMEEILKDDTINEAINESEDVMKQLDELING